MFRIIRCVTLMTLLLMTLACAQNFYNVPRESYEKKVRVLGVAPILADEESDVRQPEREALLALIRDLNRKNEPELVALLKETGAYLSVRMTEAQADQLFSSLVFRRERRSDAGVIYNKYFFKQPELKEFIEKNHLDAVMIVTVSGLTRPDKVYASNYLAYLEHDFNYLIMTAQILDADGNTLWEYPNFQQRPLSLKPLLNLQYADFDEAEANATDKVDVKSKTIPGIARAFEKSGSSVRKEGKVSRLYSAQFSEMVSMLERRLRLPWEKSREEIRVEQPGPAPMAIPAVPPRAEPLSRQAEPARIEPAQAEPAGITTETVPLTPGEIRTETLTSDNK